jgi:hypothetical protein
MSKSSNLVVKKFNFHSDVFFGYIKLKLTKLYGTLYAFQMENGRFSLKTRQLFNNCPH